MMPLLRGRRSAWEHVDVVHVITTLTAGGAERQLELIAARSHHSSNVVALYGAGQVADGMRAAGHHVEVLHATGWRKLVAPLVLARRLRRWSPSVVHVHLLSGQLLGIPAARLAGVPVVLSTEHSLMDDTIEGRPHTWWLRLLYRVLERMTTHTIAVSDVTAERLDRWGVAQDRVTVADLGIDFETLAHNPADGLVVREELGIDPDARVIGAVGRLVPVKRIDLVLRSAAPLLREGAFLVVAGDGPLREQLQRLAAHLEVADQVRWLGSRDCIGPVLSSMDVLVSASSDETFGMAVVEALGNGMPVVYVACPALDELSDRPAHAVQVALVGDDDRDAAALGTALVTSIGPLGDGRHPVPTVLRSHFGAQAAADRVDAVYDRLLLRRHG